MISLFDHPEGLAKRESTPDPGAAAGKAGNGSNRWRGAGGIGFVPETMVQWIGFKENLQENLFLNGEKKVSCRFSFQSIEWRIGGCRE